jgi:SET domain-containing protein
MLKIETFVNKSSIQGLGVFAKHFVRRGDVVWQFNEHFDVVFSREKVEKMSDAELSLLERYAWMDSGGNYVLPVDNDRFMNHSSEPNVENVTEDVSIAARDIMPGEELTTDYKTLVPRELWEDYYTR